MRNTGKFRIISVESQKGGVGKTTVALNIARMALNTTMYEVLFFDLDISGTAADIAQNTPFFGDRVKIISFPIANKKKSENLVEAYADYMQGHETPNVKWNNPSTSNQIQNPHLLLSENSINIASSYFGPSFSSLPYGPSVLFDEIHSKWFLEFVKAVIVESTRQLRGNKKLLVILDNAPGYTGLRPIVEDWLTDLGPDTGKFLFVSSLDPQDYSACLDAMFRIAKRLKVKHHAARYYQKLAKGWQLKDKAFGKAPEENKECKQFFSRLSSSQPSNEECLRGQKPQGTINCLDCGLCYYRDKVKKYVIPTSKYWISITLNRIPAFIIDKQADICWQGMVKPLQSTKCFKKLLDDPVKIGSESLTRCIAYRPEYAIHFVADYLSETAVLKKESAQPYILQPVKCIQDFRVIAERFVNSNVIDAEKYGEDIIGYIYLIDDEYQNLIKRIEKPNINIQEAFRIKWWWFRPSVRATAIIRGVPAGLEPGGNKKSLCPINIALERFRQWFNIFKVQTESMNFDFFNRSEHLTIEVLSMYAAFVALRFGAPDEGKGEKNIEGQVKRLKRLLYMINYLRRSYIYKTDDIWNIILKNPNITKEAESVLHSIDSPVSGEMKMYQGHPAKELLLMARCQQTIWQGAQDYALLETAIDIYCNSPSTEFRDIVFERVLYVTLVERKLGFNETTELLELLRTNKESKGSNPLAALKKLRSMLEFEDNLWPIIKSFSLWENYDSRLK